VPLYAFENCHVAYRFAAAPPPRVSAFRSLGAHANVVAMESMMEELAAAKGSTRCRCALRTFQTLEPGAC
jgi:nicotinate dehydrogenase subunit B